MPERSRDWINHANNDLKTAEGLLGQESFEWSCFVAQQAAEKAVKAVIQKLNAVAWGHSVYELLHVLSKRVTIDQEIMNGGRLLDRYYVPTRTPSLPAAHSNISPERMPLMPSYIAEESSNSVKVFWLKQEELVQEIRNQALALGQKDLNVLKIVLFGSLAQGRAVPGSDADILILLREDDRSFMDRMASWHRRFTLDFPVEVFAYTTEEADAPVAVEAIKKGITLFERD